ncbi:LytTR family DNA-binding domain-containing protein [Persicobacter psychrovividus]|uniref:DNA-binding response regulator n=1 Tax=Persicobacter psychrovividus TaxID=387638 RepID=A0ABM7VH06_9BACT|nr:DNA-binding response regulator [Persicobacter psychrovividus]
MKTLIIDDERLARKELTSLLKKHSEIEVIGEAKNVDDAYEKIKSLQPDLIFLDIQMPGKNGFELLSMLDKVPYVVFATAYDEYAIQAFEVNALDYLLKPIQPERLEDTIKKLMELNLPSEENGDDASESVAEVSPARDVLGVKDQVFVKDGDRCWFVKLEEIRLFESDGNYIKVHFDKYKPMIHKSLNALDERLDTRYFFRVSRKHIVNLGWIERIEPWFNGGLMLELKGGEKVEVSRRQATKFKDMMSL